MNDLVVVNNLSKKELKRILRLRKLAYTQDKLFQSENFFMNLIVNKQLFLIKGKDNGFYGSFGLIPILVDKEKNIGYINSAILRVDSNNSMVIKKIFEISLNKFDKLYFSVAYKNDVFYNLILKYSDAKVVDEIKEKVNFRECKKFCVN